MRTNGMRLRAARRVACAAILLCGATLAAAAQPAAAQMNGSLRYTRGYDLVPNPPLASGTTTMVLYGVYPTGCGAIDEESVQDSGHVTLRIHSAADCPDSSIATWTATFPLGMLAAGNHTVAITLTMDRPDSGMITYEGSLTFGVEDSTIISPPPPPPPAPPLVTFQTTDPYPASPFTPIALIVGGHAPFGCPVVTAATVIDTSHLALTLSPGPACGDSASHWTNRFELGFQREGWHFMDLAITLEGDSVVIRHEPIAFLVYSDTTGWGPPPVDSLQNVLSPSRPNPFELETRFSVSLDEAAQAEVSVFDIHGRRMSRVFSGRLEPGTTQLAWNGRRDDGSRAPSGIYFYRLAMRGRAISRRIVLLRQQ